MVKFAWKGLYTIPEAARLLHEDSPTIRRWALGYRRRGKFYPPAIKTEIPKRGSSELLTFLELIELLFIQGFLRAGVSWPKLREAAGVAARLLEDETHPFAMKKWFVDPCGIYVRLGEEHQEPVLVELVGDAQVAMESALRPYIQQIRFDSRGLARMWYPLGHDQPVLLDPRRSFGAPIVERGGVRTDLIAEHHRAGDDVATIGAWYEVEEHEVVAALEFEKTLEAA